MCSSTDIRPLYLWTSTGRIRPPAFGRQAYKDGIAIVFYTSTVEESSLNLSESFPPLCWHPSVMPQWPQ